jgi:hypothetical protein
MAGGRLYVDTQEDYDKWMAAKVKSKSTSATSFE